MVLVKELMEARPLHRVGATTGNTSCPLPESWSLVYMQQQLATRSKGPSRIVWCQHVPDIQRSLAMHCLLGHGEYLELDTVPDGKPVQGAECWGVMIPDRGAGHNVGGNLCTHHSPSSWHTGRLNNKLFRLSSLDVTNAWMMTWVTPLSKYFLIFPVFHRW